MRLLRWLFLTILLLGLVLASGFVLFSFIASQNAGRMKGLDGPIPAYLTFRPIQAVVRAHPVSEDDPTLVVDQSYFGPFKAGDRLPVDPDVFRYGIKVPLPEDQPFRAIEQARLWLSGLSQPELFLFLSHKSNDPPNPSNVIGTDLQIDHELSKRLSWRRVYLWYSGTKESPLALDNSHYDLAALEVDVAKGVSQRTRWDQARAATDPAQKLSLLRPFLIVGGDTHATPYEVWGASFVVLEEVEKAGPEGIRFLTDLLTLPSFQDDYAPDDWRGFGAQERAMVMMSLALQKSHAASSPEDKLTQLRHLFDLPQFDTDAGYDPAGLLGEYMDRGLKAAQEAGAQEGVPFLQGLLDLPQFQYDYSPSLRKDFGRNERVKIEAAITQLLKSETTQ